ncbi:MAG: M3 family oligoendopeptidase [Thermomicrobiales bacterium]
MSTIAPALPRWDMTVIYPSLTSPEFAQGFSDFVAAIDRLSERFDMHEIGSVGKDLEVDAKVASLYDELTTAYNALLAQAETLGNYIYSFVSTNSRDDVAQAKLSEYELQAMRDSKLTTRYTAWVGKLNPDKLLALSQTARDHAYVIELAAIRAAHQMSSAEEELAAELYISGASSWAKLHQTVTSQIMVPIVLDGETTTLPMTEIRNLAHDPDGEKRRLGYEAEMAAWEQHAAPLAAALNSIKGESITLLKRRKWDSALDLALFQNHIDRETLDAMLSAARESFPSFRRYFRLKAKMLEREQLSWWDLFAPIGEGAQSWGYDESTRFIVEQFGSYSQKLSEFAARAFREQWVDAGPRPGKEGGAYCMPLRGEESRILHNFSPSYAGMSTLAHELGHGYHNVCESNRTPLQKGTPSTLAETASIFCETIVRNAALANASDQEQISILESDLQGSAQVVVDISSRFLFESRVFDARAEHELSIDDFNNLMLESQRETYGDGLDQSALHPYMWAVKSHYYDARHGFYNFPYMFGLLFGLGLYARYLESDESFKAGYDELLSLTGMADAASLAARFGIDLRSVEFWRSSLALIAADIDRLAALTGIRLS